MACWLYYAVGYSNRKSLHSLFRRSLKNEYDDLIMMAACKYDNIWQIYEICKVSHLWQVSMQMSCKSACILEVTRGPWTATPALFKVEETRQNQLTFLHAKTLKTG